MLSNVGLQDIFFNVLFSQAGPCLHMPHSMDRVEYTTAYAEIEASCFQTRPPLKKKNNQQKTRKVLSGLIISSTLDYVYWLASEL